MTQLLEKAIAQVAMLPEAEQDALAAIMLEELASEERWSALFSRSQDALSKLAEEACCCALNFDQACSLNFDQGT